MSVYYEDDTVTLHHGDCIDVMRTLPANSVDAIVTDPPYGLEFMGKDWDSFGVGKRPTIGQADGSKFRQNMGTPSFTDQGNPTCKNCKGDKYRNGPRKCSCDAPNFGNPQAQSMRGFQAWCELWTVECLRVLKPGGHLLAFGGTRTWHRLAVAVEDAGFEMRDSIAWLYGSGFPKSLDVSKAIDKARGDRDDWRAVGTWLKAERERAGYTRASIAPFLGGHSSLESAAANMSNWENGLSFPTLQRWDELRALLNFSNQMDAEVLRLNLRKGEPGDAWAGRGVATEAAGTSGSLAGRRTRTVAHGTPQLVDADKWSGWGTALKPAFEPIVVARKPLVGTVAANVLAHGTGALNIDGTRVGTSGGRTVHTRSAGAERDQWSGNLPTGEVTDNGGRWPTNVLLDDNQANELDAQTGVLSSGKMRPTHTTAGVAGRGTYGADAADGFTTMETYGDSGGASRFFPTFRYQAKAPATERPKVDGIAHPTVKPLALMRWLVRLVTPPGGLVLEPFAGSGATVEACLLEGFQCIAIEREADYLPLTVARLQRHAHTSQGLPVTTQLDLFEESA